MPKKIPAGWVGSPAVAKQVVKPAVPTHLPLGAMPKRTADAEDAGLNWYPTRKVTAEDVKELESKGLNPKVVGLAGFGLAPEHAEVTPVRFHPSELPDPEAAFAVKMYPQVIPAYQVDPKHVTHDLSTAVAVDDPVRARFKK